MDTSDVLAAALEQMDGVIAREFGVDGWVGGWMPCAIIAGEFGVDGLVMFVVYIFSNLKWIWRTRNLMMYYYYGWHCR